MHSVGSYCRDILRRTVNKTLNPILDIYFCIMVKYFYAFCGPGSSVGIATDYGLDGPGIESRWGENFRPSRPALGPTQPPVQWVPGLSRGKVRPGRAAGHSPPSWKSRAITVPPSGPQPGL